MKRLMRRGVLGGAALVVVTPPLPATPVIRTTVYPGGDVLTSIAVVPDERLIAQHVDAVVRAGAELRARARGLVGALRLGWGLLALVTTVVVAVRASWAAAGIVVLSCAASVALRALPWRDRRLGPLRELIVALVLTVLAVATGGTVSSAAWVSAGFHLSTWLALMALRAWVRSRLRSAVRTAPAR